MGKNLHCLFAAAKQKKETICENSEVWYLVDHMGDRSNKDGKLAVIMRLGMLII